MYARRSVTLDELEKGVALIVRAAADGPVAVTSDDQPEAYLVAAEEYERLIDLLEDLQDAETIRQRSGEVGIPVKLDDL